MHLHVAFGIVVIAFYCAAAQAQGIFQLATPEDCASARQEYQNANSAVDRDKRLADVRCQQLTAPQCQALLKPWGKDLDRLGHAITVEAKACRPVIPDIPIP
jgi:hypothetical protein